MATGKITAEALKKLVPIDRDAYLWDSELAGFGLKVTPRGKFVFIVQYRLGGRGHSTKRYTIGTWPAWKPDQARDEAKRLMAEKDRGADVAAIKRETKRVAVELAFNKFVPDFCDNVLKEHWPKSWKQTKACLERHAVPVVKDKPLPDISSADVRRMLKALDAHPATKRNLFAALSYLFNRAIEDGHIAESPLAGVAKVKMVAPRDRTLSDDELRWLWTAASEEPRPYSDVVQHLLFWGQRRSEVSGLPWSELDRASAEWRLPAERAKNGTANVIPLTTSRMAFLDKLAGGERWPRRGLVFPSSAKTPLSGFSKMKRRLDKRMGELAEEEGAEFVPWVLHDLRRTFVTNMQRMGIPFEVTEHLVNHRERSRAGIAHVYQRHGYAMEKRAALEKWEAQLSVIVEGSGGRVIPFAAKG